jgi:hypothetical protein
LIETTARPRALGPDALFEVEHLGLRAEPEPHQKFRRQQRDVMAGGTIDPHEARIACSVRIARRQWVAVVIDSSAKLFDQSGGFVIRQVKVRHDPDMVSLMALMNLIEQRRAVRGSTGRRSKA